MRLPTQEAPAVTQTFKHAIIACHPLENSFTLSVARRTATPTGARPPAGAAIC